MRHEEEKANKDFDAALARMDKSAKEEMAKRFKNFSFNIFAIKDNEKLIKGYCWACEKGMKCRKHPPKPLEKKEEALMTEREFTGEEKARIRARQGKIRIQTELAESLTNTGKVKASDIFWARSKQKEKEEQEKAD